MMTLAELEKLDFKDLKEMEKNVASAIATFNARRIAEAKAVNGGAKVGHGGGAKPGQLVRLCAMTRALPI